MPTNTCARNEGSAYYIIGVVNKFISKIGLRGPKLDEIRDERFHPGCRHDCKAQSQAICLINK